MEDDYFEEVEDNDWDSSPKLSKEEKRKLSQEKWEESKKDWSELSEEKFENKLEGKWVQKGPYLYKKDAKLEFGTYIGNDYMLTGIDDKGQPILAKKN